MPQQIVTKGIILSRTDFGEADRILMVLTPDHGKIRLMAKGVRKIKSKLAGGIELFSVSDVSFISGRGEIGTLTSSRLKKHFDQIVKNIDRTMFGYELLKIINRATEDNAGEEYFILLQSALAGLDDEKLSQELLQLWLYMQLLKLGGHSPNLKTDKAGNKLATEQKYTFNIDDMNFVAHLQGPYSSGHIKMLRLAIGLESPLALQKVQDSDRVLPEGLQLAKTMLTQFIRI
jgi:DNA repair protein RecO (recombination protein O)